jgi:hypothetical protein
MAVCPGGHESASDDFCAVCGLRMGGRPVPSFQTTFGAPAVPAFSPGPFVPSTPPSSFPYSQTTWTAVVVADRAYYDQVQQVTGPQGAAVAFPGRGAERRFHLVGHQMRIGRRSWSRGIAPEIDLSGPPADPGISRLHAVLIAVPNASWAVLDPGSANGTLVNGTVIAIGDQVRLQDGDRINLGAWTAITVHRDDHLGDYRAPR